MKPKRLVHYDQRFPYNIMVGFGAVIKPIDHDSDHVSNNKMVITSAVRKYDGDGCFETDNSLYIPAKLH
jgi:hypothetical protein